jgi:hypothetical protein
MRIVREVKLSSMRSEFSVTTRNGDVVASYEAIETTASSPNFRSDETGFVCHEYADSFKSSDCHVRSTAITPRGVETRRSVFDKRHSPLGRRTEP